MRHRIFLLLIILLCITTPLKAQEPGSVNLLVAERGVTLVDFSSEYGGWEAASMIPSLARLAEPGVTIEDFVWCTADDAPFPHWVVFEFKKPQWLTTFVFNNVLKDEPAYPGISARHVEVWVGTKSAKELTKMASFDLERNKSGQSVQISPVEARWIKFNITSNWGHPTWTELNATAAYDDGSRPADFSTELKKRGKVDMYGVYFDFNSATLRPESRKALDEILAFQQANPQQHIVIEGHTDNAGSDRYNIDLSQRRANAVIAELSRLGAQSGQLEAVGYGAAQPVARNDSEAGRAKNRRVTVRLTTN